MDSTNPSLRHFRKLLYGETEPNELNDPNDTSKIEIISDINLEEEYFTDWAGDSSNSVSEIQKTDLSKLTDCRLLKHTSLQDVIDLNNLQKK